jgi:hypothetical protein
MLIVRPEIETGGDWTPDPEIVKAMTAFNEELSKAGVLLGLDGLHPQESGALVRFAPGKKPAVTDGPYAEAKEVIGGFWLIQARSKDEAVEWATRAPQPTGTIEVRQVFEVSDFPADVQEAAKHTQLLREQAVAS